MIKTKLKIAVVLQRLLVLIAAAVLVTGCQDAATDADSVSPELVDAVVQQLADSGKLDKAVEHSIQQLMTKQRKKQASSRKQRQQQLEQRAAALPKPNFNDEHLLGSPDAPVSMIEYSDFECPFCKRFHETPQKVLEKFGDKLNLVFRVMPLSSHGEAAFVEARAGECVAELAGNDAFWPYSNQLFEHSGSNGKGIGGGETIYTLAAKQDVSHDKLDACMDDANIKQVLDSHLATAKSLGISGTPTTIIRNWETGNTKVVVGAASEASLVAAVNEVLADQK